jgi:hypothetical protein
MRPLSDEEVWAQDCIRVALPGSTVKQHDDGSEPGMYDLTITYPDGRIGAIEVTAAADAQQLELWKLIRRRGRPWIEPSLAGGWLVQIQPSARSNLLKKLPDLLSRLERADQRFVRGSDSADQTSTLASELRIIEARQSPTDRPGSIYVMPPQRLGRMGGSSPVTGDPLARWLSAWIPDPSRSDNLGKLARSGAPERHLFVLVPGFNEAPFAVNDLLIAPNAPLPTIPPVLPPEITHVWTVSTWDSGDGFLYALETGWTRFVKV